MFLAAFLVGLREGLEASLIVGILLAAAQRRNAPEAKRIIWIGAVSAAAICIALGALFTFGRYGLSFKAQEGIGGILSLVAVAMITVMVLSMSNKDSRLNSLLDAKTGAAIAAGASAMFWMSFITVGREGLELTLLMWGWVVQPAAIIGAFAGIALAILLGYLIFKGALKMRLSTFFNVSSALLIVVAAGILAYAVHDLQEATLLPGPFSGAPIAPTHPRTGEVLVGFATYPFWMASFPFGWAFDVSDSIDPTGVTATFLQALTGFEPKMSWLQVVAWLIYVLVVVPIFINHLRRPATAAAPAATVPATPAEPAGPTTPAAASTREKENA